MFSLAELKDWKQEFHGQPGSVQTSKTHKTSFVCFINFIGLNVKTTIYGFKDNFHALTIS